MSVSLFFLFVFVFQLIYTCGNTMFVLVLPHLIALSLIVVSEGKLTCYYYCYCY